MHRNLHSANASHDLRAHELSRACVTNQSLKHPERTVMWHQLPSCGVSIALMKCVCEVSLCLYVRAKGLEGDDVCLLSEEVCKSVWQWIIDSESQSQILLRKHKACMPGHIPVCLFIQLSGLSVGRYDVTERRDYDWRVGRHQNLSCLTSTICHP